MTEIKQVHKQINFSPSLKEKQGEEDCLNVGRATEQRKPNELRNLIIEVNNAGIQNHLDATEMIQYKNNKVFEKITNDLATNRRYK